MGSRAKVPRLRLLSEAEIQSACTDLLRLDGWRPIRTDPVSDRARGKGFGELGMADMQYVRYSTRRPLYRTKRAGGALAETLPRDCWVQLIWIEWKKMERSGRPTEASPRQQEWHRDERIRGAVTFIAGEDFPATIEGFDLWYRRESGLYRQQTPPPGDAT